MGWDSDKSLYIIKKKSGYRIFKGRERKEAMRTGTETENQKDTTPDEPIRHTSE